MSSFLTAFNQVIILFAIVMVGVVVGKCGIVTAAGRKELSKLLTSVTLPCMVFNSMMVDLEPGALGGIIRVFLYGFIMVWVGFFIGIPLAKMLGKGDISKSCVYHFGIIYSNFGFVGFPVCEALFGAKGLFYASVMAVAFNTVFFFLADMLFGAVKGQERKGFNWKSQISPMNVAVVLGVVCFFNGYRPPSQIRQVVSMLAAVTTPLAMCISGIALASTDIKSVWKNAGVFVYSAIRLLVMPLLFLGVMKLLHISGLEMAVPVMVAAMPAVANVTMFAEIYDADTVLAAQAVFVSTLLSVLTIPLVASLVV